VVWALSAVALCGLALVAAVQDEEVSSRK